MGRDRTEQKGTSLSGGLHLPHTEVQRQAYVSGDLQDMVWGQPDLGLSIKEGKEIEAGRSDAWNGEKGGQESVSAAISPMDPQTHCLPSLSLLPC